MCKIAVPVLHEFLKDNNLSSFDAAVALGEIDRPDAEPAIPALIDALMAKRMPTQRPPSGGYRRRRSPIGKIGPAAIPALVKVLKDK